MDLGLALILSGSVFLFSLLIFAFYSFKSGRKQDTDIIPDLVKMQQEHLALKTSLQALDELTTDYFVTMNENGFKNLCSLEEAVAQSLACCEELLSQNRLREAEEILHFLYVKRGSCSVPAGLSQLLGANAAHLTDWGRRSKELVSRLSNCVSESSRQMKEFGSKARRVRKRTMMILDQVQNNLSALE